MEKKDMARPRIIILVALCALGAALAFHWAFFNREAVVIRIHDDQIDIQKLTNEIARFVLVNGYGYRVELVESTIKEVHDRLQAGDIDVTLELWKENNLVWYDTAKGKGEVVDLGPIYPGGRQYWIIPRWYARQKNIKTVFDMKAHWRDFTNPEDPSKGIFFNCIFGWSCQDINRAKLSAYGLDRYFNTVSPTSPEALESIYENARAHGLPVFGYYWEPNALIANQDWYPLEEPPYEPEIWDEVVRAAADPKGAPPEKACAFKQIHVHKMANRRLLDKAPDAAEMLGNMRLTPEIFNDILFSNLRRKSGPKAFEAMAVRFFTEYPDTWHGWVTADAKRRIQAALGTGRE